jgi:hypothetical protein
VEARQHRDTPRPIVSQWHKISHSDLFGRLVTVALFIASFSLLSPFMFPHTFLDTISTVRFWPTALYGGMTKPDSFISLAIALLSWFMYYMPYVRRDEQATAGLWFGVLAVLLIYGFSAVFTAGGTRIINPVTSILIVFSVGLLAARSCRNIATCMAMMAIVCAVEASYAMAGYLSHTMVFISGNLARADGSYGDPITLGIIMLVGLPATVYMMNDAKHVWTKFPWAAAVAIEFAVTLLTWSRGILCGLVAIGLWAAFSNGRRAKPALLAVSFVALFVFCIFIRANGPTNSASVTRSNYGHLNDWRLGVLVFADHPLAGIGVGEWQLPVAPSFNNQIVGHLLDDPHNQVLAWLDQTGCIGACVLLALLLSVHKAAFASKAQDAYWLRLIWIGIAAACMFCTPFGLVRRECSNALLGFLLGMTLIIGSFGNSNYEMATET